MIIIQSCVKLEEIDPIYFDKSYFLKPEENVSRPFNLFLRALADKHIVAIGSFALRSKERFCCLRPVGNTLIAETLLDPDEININLKTKLTKIKVSAQEMAMVSKLIDMMAEPFHPENFKGNYCEALQKVIEEKIEGHEIKKPVKAAENGQLLDLMTALKRSVERAEGNKSGKTSHAQKVRRQRKVG